MHVPAFTEVLLRLVSPFSGIAVLLDNAGKLLLHMFCLFLLCCVVFEERKLNLSYTVLAKCESIDITSDSVIFNKLAFGVCIWSYDVLCIPLHLKYDVYGPEHSI